MEQRRGRILRHAIAFLVELGQGAVRERIALGGAALEPPQRSFPVRRARYALPIEPADRSKCRLVTAVRGFRVELERCFAILVPPETGLVKSGQAEFGCSVALIRSE